MVVEGGMQEIPSKHKNSGEVIGNQKKRLFSWGSEGKKLSDFEVKPSINIDAKLLIMKPEL